MKKIENFPPMPKVKKPKSRVFEKEVYEAISDLIGLAVHSGNCSKEIEILEKCGLFRDDIS